MTLQSSGAISLLDVRNELGLSGTISLNDSAVRTLLGRASGQISLSDAYGKSSAIIPGVPGTPSYSNQTATSVTVNWSAATNAINYDLMVLIGSSWYVYGTTSGTSYSVTNATTGQLYTFMIRARSTTGHTTDGSSSQITLLYPAPSVSVSSITSNSFNATASGQGTYFRLQLWLEWNGAMQTDNVYSYAGGYVAYTNWYENSSYNFKIAVCDASGNVLSPWTTSSSFKTLEWDAAWYGSQATLPFSQAIAIGSASDVDTYWFYATSTTHTITFNATYSPVVNFDTYLELYRYSDGALIFSNDDTNGLNAAITATGLTVGNVYVVKARSYNFGSWGNGTLSIT